MQKKQTMPKEMRERISRTLKEKGIKPKVSFKARGVNHPMYGKHHTEESKLKISHSKKGHSPAPNKGKQLSEETRKKISDAQIGRIPWNKGKTECYSQETREKISASMIGVRGENARRWKGGTKLSNARRAHRRRNGGFGFIPLNDCDDNTWVGHHLDKEHVLYIPKELHESVRHSVVDNVRMDIINEKAIDWYINYYGLQ